MHPTVNRFFYKNYLKELYMKRGFFILSLLALLALPVQGTAQDHSAHGGQSDKAAPAAPGNAQSGHEAMMHGGAIMLPEVTVDGVKGMVHLMDTGAMMAKMGKKENYHFMVAFSEAASGKTISEGSVALKITGPGEAKAGEPLALMAMAGQFGADISLPGKGIYTLEVGSKLADGAKRQFKFQYTVK
jgi:hypothetical protein